MRKTIAKFHLLLVAGILSGLFTTGKVLASHAQGSDLTYQNVAPNVYVVNYKLYRDCSGIDPGTSQTLTYRAPGCDATSRLVSMPRTGNPVVGDPYCGNIPPQPCSGTSSSLANYQENVYSTTITLPSLCENWILSARIGNRPYSRNLANGQTAWLFSEALINNVATQTNNSPTFGNIPIPFVCVDLPVTYNQNVTDVDGDSVVYTLMPALNDLNQPVVYGNYLGTGTGTNPYPAGMSPAGTLYPQGNFSATNPIISRNPLALHPVTGSMQFEPLEFKGPAFISEQGLDKYTVAMQVDEYRKINGVPVKIGHVRRDILIIVIDCGTNSLPELDSVLVRSVKYAPGSVVETGIGQPLQLTFFTLDANPQDIVRLNTNVGAVLPGATFYVAGGPRPTGTVTWTPTAADIRQMPYFFTIHVRDNSCPMPGYQTFTMGVRVSANGPTGLSKASPAVSFVAYPNPAPGPEVTFKISGAKTDKNAEMLILNVAGRIVDRIPVAAGAGEVQWHKKPGLPAGVYFARYTSAAGTQTIKLVHQK